MLILQNAKTHQANGDNLLNKSVMLFSIFAVKL
jgi:hypothetical protein